MYQNITSTRLLEFQVPSFKILTEMDILYCQPISFSLMYLRMSYFMPLVHTTISGSVYKL